MGDSETLYACSVVSNNLPMLAFVFNEQMAHARTRSFVAVKFHHYDSYASMISAEWEGSEDADKYKQIFNSILSCIEFALFLLCVL